ncbi:hypothetical protein PIB30_111089 [Stylosanthes scabra]|uniref:Ribonuclease H1 N-terminal domain-containing protein n=1 Tax=Stylosanthes scabra TaxID=79078 RepID=A0ABU6VYS2_9FABA|nr:hypothetical protein [Stylosanthes scabra]
MYTVSEIVTAIMRSMERKKYNYYAVRKGRVTGIYTSWKEAEKQVKGFRNCDYKGFKSRRDAFKYMNHRHIVDGHVTAAGSSSAADPGSSSAAAGGSQSNPGEEHKEHKEDKESLLIRALEENAKFKEQIATLKRYINSI